MSFGRPKQPEAPPPPPNTPTLADASVRFSARRDRARSLINSTKPAYSAQGAMTAAATGKRTLIGGA